MPFIDCTPIAAAERLARYERDTFNADCDSITTTLTTWRDREGLALSDSLLTEVAAHVADASPRRAA